MYDDNNVETWLNIEQDSNDIEEESRLYVADTVNKWMDMSEDCGDALPDTFSGWSDILGEELSWDKEQNGWDEEYFERFCGRCDALLPFFLENWQPIVDYNAEHGFDWDA